MVVELTVSQTEKMTVVRPINLSVSQRLHNLLRCNAEPARLEILAAINLATAEVNWLAVEATLLRRLNLAIKISRQFHWLVFRFGPQLRPRQLETVETVV